MRSSSWLVSLVLLAGCEGSLTPLGPSSPQDATNAECGLAVPGPAPLRRLTNDEYVRSAIALVGDAGAAPSFPEEAVGAGFVNDSAAQSVSGLLIESYETAARQYAAIAVTDLPRALGCDPAVMGEDPCVEQFIGTFGLRAWRRPLTTEERTDLLAFFTSSRTSWGFHDAVRMLFEVFLQSANFVYRHEALGTQAVSEVSRWELATRMSYFLWGTTPDDALLRAAELGALDTDEGLEREARRMIDDPRTEAVAESFFAQWLDVDRVERQQKNPLVFPMLTTEVKSALRTEARAFVGDVFRGQGDLDTLLTDPHGFVNAELASFYGVPQPASGWDKVMLPHRSGVLTLSSILAGYAKADQTDPIMRGAWVGGRFLCRHPPPPPNNVPPFPEPTPNTSNRQRLAAHRTNPSCSGCHQQLEPLGLGLEEFDGQGLWRSTEAGAPVDTSGEIIGVPGLDGPFVGAAGLAAKLRGSAVVETCVTTQMFRFAYGRVETPAERCTVEALASQFHDDGARFKALMLRIVTNHTFRQRTTPVSELP